jgi:hypothetical protein
MRIIVIVCALGLAMVYPSLGAAGTDVSIGLNLGFPFFWGWAPPPPPPVYYCPPPVVRVVPVRPRVVVRDVYVVPQRGYAHYPHAGRRYYRHAPRWGHCR